MLNIFFAVYIDYIRANIFKTLALEIFIFDSSFRVLIGAVLNQTALVLFFPWSIGTIAKTKSGIGCD